MSFRTRLALVAAAAVALAVVAASFAVFFIVKGQLYGSVAEATGDVSVTVKTESSR